MKVIRWGLFLLMLCTSCEKDDICVEGDTPLLVIRFYDADNPTLFKAVPSLRVQAEGEESPVSTIADRTSTLDSIAIPLRIDPSGTSFSFILDSADDADGMETGNVDALAFSYEIKDQFISRACGFVANYDSLDDTLASDTDNWIERIEIITPLIESSNTLTAHVQIFH